METPKVTIGVTTHHESTNVLKRCLDSILRQTYKNIEIILVNDKSVYDDIDEFVTEYRNEHSIDLVYIKTPINVKYAKAKNLCMISGTGEYFLPLDADQEMIDVFFIENSVEVLCNNNNYYAVVGKIINDTNRNKSFDRGYYTYYFKGKPENEICCGGIGYTIFRLEDFSSKAIFLESGNYSDDKFFIQLAVKNTCIGKRWYIYDVLARYSILNHTETNRTSNVSIDEVDKEKLYEKEIREYINNITDKKM